VHRQLGPGLLEGTYESAYCIELDDAGRKYQRQLVVPVIYKGRNIGEYRVDLLVEDAVIVEIKSVERFQLLTYLRITGKKVGLLINFNSRLLKDGVKDMSSKILRASVPLWLIKVVNPCQLMN
jgi:GxxExxY protein